MAEKLSTIFLGSGPVARRSLQLLASDFQFEAIVTKPATIQAMQSVLPSVATYAVSNKKELNDLCAQQRFQSSFAILIDFGIIVSQAVIDTFPLGIINSHFSLLPEWRGADPISFAILSGQSKTGVSLMLLTAGMDEGPLLAQSAYTIPEDATTPILTEALIQLSDAALKTNIPLYANDALRPKPQPTDIAPTYSRKLTKDDGLIDWMKPATQIEREIRAYIEWPKSRATLAGREVVITAARVENTSIEPGKVIADHQRLIVGCGTNSLDILRLKPAGKQEMGASAFLAGYRKFL